MVNSAFQARPDAVLTAVDPHHLCSTGPSKILAQLMAPGFQILPNRFRECIFQEHNIVGHQHPEAWGIQCLLRIHAQIQHIHEAL